LAERVAAHLDAERELGQGRVADDLALLVHLPPPVGAADDHRRLPDRGKDGVAVGALELALQARVLCLEALERRSNFVVDRGGGRGFLHGLGLLKMPGVPSASQKRRHLLIRGG
jgi:hypothetical protein